MNNSHKEVCEKIYELARYMLKETGRVAQGYFVIKEDVAMLLALPKELDQIPDDDQYKIACFQTAKAACDQLEGEALVHVSQAWSAEGTKEELDNYKGEYSKHPRRKESVVLVYMCSTGERSAFIGHLVNMADSNEKTLEEGKWIEIKDLPLFDIAKPSDIPLQ